jgi:deazaflavin-dependent oxidoreductase (nitroreductase family)
MSLPHSHADLGFKVTGRVHRAVLQLSGGRVGGTVAGMPVVELRTTGRTSGQQRSTTLTAPIADESRVVLVASKGGADRDPDWYRNLVANPEVEVIIAGRRRLMRARTASPQEKAELWPRVLAANPGYGGYQRRTQREIPLIICEPRSVDKSP